MENINLIDAQSRTHFFQQRVLINIRYWQNWVEEKIADVTAMDRYSSCVVRAITFAFRLDESWVSVYNLIVIFSPYMERRGHWDIWKGVLSQAVEMARRVEDRQAEVTLSLLLARLLFRQNRFQDSTQTYRRTIRLARHIGDAESEARACSNLGFLYVELDFRWRAELLCCHALAIFERLEHAHGRAHTHNHLGVLSIQQRQWQVAEQHLEQACRIWRDHNDIHGLMWGLLNLGHLYIEIEQPDQALHCLNEALECAKVTGEESEVANIYNNIGISHRLNNNPVKAETYLWQAEAIFRRTSNTLGLAQVLANLGLACLAQKKLTAAKQHFESALASYQLLKNPYRELRIMLYLVNLELTRGDKAGATKRLEEVICKLKPYKEDEKYQDLRTHVWEYQQLIGTSSSLP